MRDAGRLNQTTQMGYDGLGDVTALTDPNGNLTQSAWDADRRLVQVTAPPAPQALVTAYRYDPDGRLVGTTQSASGTVLSTTSASYTPSGQLASATDANGNVTRYAYDPADRLAQVTDAVGRVTTYGYDALSRRTGVFNPAIQGGALLALGYTPDGLLASLADAAGHTTSYTYDGFDRLAATTYPDNTVESLTYDANGNVLTRHTRKGDAIAFAYDTLNRVCTKTYAATPVACGGTSANYLVGYGYDLAGRLTGVGDNSAAITTPTTTASYTASTSYDAMNRPLAVNWSPAPAQTAPTASSATFGFGYDPTNRRTSANASDNSWWDYPPNTTTTTTAYTANNLNQYSAVSAVSPTYDGNGNLTYDGVFTYGYDAESRLTSIKQGSTAVASYAWDAQGRRKSKTVGTTTTLFVTDADNREVLEYDGASGAIERWYAFGQGPDAVLGQMNVALGTRETMIPDIQGSIVGTLDSGTGALTKSGYQPFGENPTLTSGTFRYTARRFDPETAGSAAQPSGLYYYRARMYSPTWGRFPQPDPIGYAGGSNLYAYVGNDPLNLTDPLGLCDNPKGCGGGILGALIPGGGASSQAFAQLQQGNYGSAALQFGRGLAEAGLFVASIGGGTAALQAARAAVSVAEETAEAIAEEATLVCRGGLCTAERFTSGSGVTIDVNGTLQGVSVNSAPGVSLSQLTSTIRNARVGVTTLGDIEVEGGTVTPAPTISNPYHCILCGITPTQAEDLFTPTVPNPSR